MNYIVSDNPIKVFEKQSGLIRLLIYLVEHEPINVKSVIENTNIYSNIMYALLQKVKKRSLISTKSDHPTYLPLNMISFTDKGRKVAEYLKKIEVMLEK
jgi:hypothetical protein